MNATPPITEPTPLSWKATALAAGCAVACFHLAYAHSVLAPLMLGYLGGLVALTRAASNRRAFYTGLGVGLAVFVPQMSFLWTIFGVVSVPLWLVLAFWSGLFVLLGRQCWRRFGAWTWQLLPVLWTGLEYFRSELYFLRFSWLNVGFAFWEWPALISTLGGGYGVGLALMAVATWFAWLGGQLSNLWCDAVVWWRGMKWELWHLLVALLIVGGGASAVVGFVPVGKGVRTPPKRISVAGIQMEFPYAHKVPAMLDQLLRAHPEAELLVLSEYTFNDAVPDAVKDWCRENRRWLIAGGMDKLVNGQFYNTAFVVSTNGEVVFQQAKAVPIQFFHDGLPAPEQKLWDSPWGKIGICICYDMSFTRVTDELIRQGAQAIINPTMDVVEWGERQHRLHSRVPPVRAAEYGVPICRVASSGISQIVSSRGQVLASASFPGQGEMIAGELVIPRRGSRAGRPIDRFLAPACTFVTGVVILYLSLTAIRARLRRPAVSPTTSSPNS